MHHLLTELLLNLADGLLADGELVRRGARAQGSGSCYRKGR